MGTSDAQKYLLFIKKFKNVQHRQSSTIRGEKAVFSINSIGQYDGGQYYCFYVTTSGWSAQSDNLELVVTGKRYLPRLYLQEAGTAFRMSLSCSLALLDKVGFVRM